ncbi:MAG: hypothetical protein DRJ38_05720 [Thermoprotei archaeon]|nr:MAG: hypothetical protein DRJ38_05720 [Thermoprotei archaeon]
MMAKEVIISRLKEYFLSRGVELLLPEELKLDNAIIEFFDLFLRDGNNLIAIKAYSPGEKLAPRIKKELEVLVVTSLKVKDFIDKAYIAIPEEIGLLKIPQEIFENAGVGILVVSDKEIEERLPARAFRRYSRSIDNALREEILRFSEELNRFSHRIERELDKVRNELSVLSRRIDSLYEDLNVLKEDVRRLKHVKERKIEEIKPLRVREKVSVRGIEDLPDFISDNPWVSILIKRGKEE